MNSHHVIGIMGPGESASDSDKEVAYNIGKVISRLGFTLLTGGRNVGVMEAAMHGAKDYNGVTVGIMPGNNTENMSQFVDIPIVTGMGNAHNVINILSSNIVIIVGEGTGTISEVALALKSQKPIIWYNFSPEAFNYFIKFQNTSVFFMELMNAVELEQLIKKLTSNR